MLWEASGCLSLWRVLPGPISSPVLVGRYAEALPNVFTLSRSADGSLLAAGKIPKHLKSRQTPQVSANIIMQGWMGVCFTLWPVSGYLMAGMSSI